MAIFLVASAVVSQLIEWRLEIDLRAAQPSGSGTPDALAPDVQFWISAGGSAAQAVALTACLALAGGSVAGGLRRLLLGAPAPPRQAIAIVAAGFVAAMSISYPVLWVTLSIVKQLLPGYTAHEHSVIDVIHSGKLAVWQVGVLWFGAGVIAPLAEEAFFRGMVQTSLFRLFRRRAVAVICASVFFGAAHATLPQTIPAMIVLGLILGFAYEATDALAAPVIIHALFNLVTLIGVALGVA